MHPINYTTIHKFKTIVQKKRTNKIDKSEVSERSVLNLTVKRTKSIPPYYMAHTEKCIQTKI